MSTNGKHEAQVHQVLATLGYGDAIGNEVLGIQKVLQGTGNESRIYVETVDPLLEDRTVDYRQLLADSDADNILIHHFSIASRASRVAFALPERMILVYHNITPPQYFIGVNPTLVEACYNGRRELGAYVPRCDFALGDSEFNRIELEQMGFQRTGVLPVVPNFDHLEVAPNDLLARDFDDASTNILFVGRLIPNKRIEDLVRFFHAYRLKYNSAAKLLLVGSHHGFEKYVASVSGLIASLRTPDVHFIGHVSNEQLVALYDVADLYLSASEHEGFCVPLIEAFYKRIPVMAFDAAVVPATMDGGGVLYDHKDARHVAALMHAVLSNQALQEEILRTQDSALDRLLQKDFSAKLLGFVDKVRHAPRRPHPPVTLDFWHQFDRANELEKLQRYRPSAFQALPKPSKDED